ncbi:hypothetical protein B0T18DRAFT_442299 [Schizothecium vesticola]|uniref:Heterokaryon incompatibility domain-containing protein n=1 Tax=Schizothecium vesticola TaxID=314040 RepID=A0AA40F9S9_9PEZI|nr:hypothetical protein B0T18DRAFT_442299 [Schizothecium vesticola]
MEYKALPIPGREIRLITILKPDDDDNAAKDMIRCTMNTMKLPQLPKDFDISVTPEDYPSFDDEVQNEILKSRHSLRDRVVERVSNGLRKKAGLETFTRDDLVIPTLDIAKLLTADDLAVMARHQELNDSFRVSWPLDDEPFPPGKLAFKDLSPFYGGPKQAASNDGPWGATTPTVPIVIYPQRADGQLLDGQRVEVRQNLEAGLRRFRKMEYFRRGGKIWIDAICINQDDDVEKNAQVQMIAFIYKLASNIIV